MQNGAKFAIAGLLIVAAVLYLIISNAAGTAHYFLTVDELLAVDEESAGRAVTVSGAVLGDTIVYDPTIPRVTFTIAHVPADPQEVELAGGLAQVLHEAVSDPKATHLDVVYDDVRPDLLQHKAQAIVHGKLGEDGRFYADELYLKCPSRYEEHIPDQVEGP